MMKTYYAIKRPRLHRRTFSVTRKVVRDDGHVSYDIVDDPRVTAINKALAEGHQDQEKSYLQLKVVVKELTQQERPPKHAVFSQENIELVRRYWESEYAHVRLRDPRSMRGDLDRAARAVGTVPIASASARELQKAVNRACPQARRQRRVVQRLNEMLSWLNRDFKLDKDRDDVVEIRYLTLEEMRTLSPHLRNDIDRAFIWTLFGTGGRHGEVCALTEARFYPERGVAHITGQRLTDWTWADTKNGRHPKAPVVPEALEWVKKWVALDEETKQSYRRVKAVDILKPACRVAFPKNRSKWVHFHELRHSYAIYLAANHCRLREIASAIGDTEQTTSMHYAGFIQSEEEVDDSVQRLRLAALQREALAKAKKGS